MNQLLTLPQFILSNATALIKSISKAMVVFYDNELNKEIMLCSDCSDGNGFIKTEDFDYSKVRPILRDKNWQWLTSSEMPFIENKNNRVQNLTLFDENKIKYLQINLNNKLKESVIICYFEFGEQNPLFGHASELTLTTENKTLIANMMYNYILTIIDIYTNQNAHISILHQQFKTSEHSLKQLYNRGEVYRNSNKDLITQFCDIRLNELSKKYGINIKLSEQSLKNILQHNMQLNQIDDVLLLSVEAVRSFNSFEDSITIEPWHLTIEADNVDLNFEEPTINDVRYLRTVELLNRLEAAGVRAKKANQKLTGTTVGMLCDTPISAPAVTDALKKHGNRIIKLMNLYPDKWSLLRSDFRPLQNLLDMDTTINNAI